jgi:hypothetical protein
MKRKAKSQLSLSKIRASAEAIRLASAILEVLAGGRSTTEAAEALAVSVPRYYALEARAVEGLVLACEPRKRGRQRTSVKELESLRREKARLERECARSQALLRMAQRAVGFAPPASAEKKKGAKRRKRPHARALVAIQALAAHNGPDAEAQASSASQDDVK